MMGLSLSPEQGREATGEAVGGGVVGGCAVSLRLAERVSCGGVSGLADGAEEFVAGALNGLGGVEVSGRGGELAEGFEGDAGPEEAFRAGHGSEPLVGCGDIVLPVGLPDAAAGAGDLGVGRVLRKVRRPVRYSRDLRRL